MGVMTIDEFRPLALTLENIGPFREPYTLNFTHGTSNEPCNFYMLVAKNGFGKTTVFDTFSSLMAAGCGKPSKLRPRRLGQRARARPVGCVCPGFLAR